MPETNEVADLEALIARVLAGLAAEGGTFQGATEFSMENVDVVVEGDVVRFSNPTIDVVERPLP